MSQTFLTAAASILASKDLICDAADMAPHLRDWRHMFSGKALAVCMPRTTTQVAALVRLCAEHGTAIVPQGGNTSLSGAATPDDSGNCIVLNLTRMNQIRQVDRIGLTAVVEAGVIIDTLRAALADQNRDVPISFGATGSATIGGAIATNAGGANVLRAGMTGRMVLGLEVVLADGSVVSQLSGSQRQCRHELDPNLCRIGRVSWDHHGRCHAACAASTRERHSASGRFQS